MDEVEVEKIVEKYYDIKAVLRAGYDAFPACSEHGSNEPEWTGEVETMIHKIGSSLENLYIWLTLSLQWAYEDLCKAYGGPLPKARVTVAMVSCSGQDRVQTTVEWVVRMNPDDLVGLMGESMRCAELVRQSPQAASAMALVAMQIGAAQRAGALSIVVDPEDG